MQRNHLRRSSFGSTTSLRRSSISAKDIQAIQTAIQKQQRLSSQLIGFLIPFIPLFSYFYLYAIHLHLGKFALTLQTLFTRWPFILQIFPPLDDMVAWKIVVILISVQLLFHCFLPHDTVKIMSSGGDYNKNVNGFFSYVLLCLLYVLGSLMGLYRGDIIFLHFNTIMLIFGILAIVLLSALGIFYRFFNQDYDFSSLPELYFGVELHPTLLDIDLKYFTRSRITFGIWPLLVISAVLHEIHVKGQLSNALFGLSLVQMAYITKYHWNEDLALNSVDERRAHCGFFRLWSDLVLNPVLFSSPIAIIVHQKKGLSLVWYSAVTLLGVLAVLITSSIDRQKYEFRKSKGLRIKGVDAFFITAKYKTDTGEPAANLLLGSGFWSYCRHPNYLTESLIFLSFVLFQGFSSLFSYLPLVYVSGYLLVRLLNDESRCLAKYGQYWLQYTSKIPFKIIPGLY